MSDNAPRHLAIGLVTLAIGAIVAFPLLSAARGGASDTSFEPRWLEGQEELVSDNTMPLHGWGDDGFIHLWKGKDVEVRVVWGGEQARHFDANATVVMVNLEEETISAPVEIGATVDLPPVMDKSGDAVLVSRSFREFQVKRGDESRQLAADAEFDPFGAMGLWTPEGPVYVSALGELLDLRGDEATLSEIFSPDEGLKLHDLTRCGESLLLLSTNEDRDYALRRLDRNGQLQKASSVEPPEEDARLSLLCGDDKPVLLAVGKTGVRLLEDNGEWQELADADQLTEWGDWHTAAVTSVDSDLQLLWITKGADDGSFTIYSASTSDLSDPVTLFSVSESQISSFEDFQCLSANNQPVCAARVVWDFGNNMATTPLLLHPGISGFRWQK